MDGAIITQGKFAQGSTAVSKYVKIRQDADWMKVLNFTIADANQTTAVGVEYFWQRGMAQGRGIIYKKSNAANAANLTDVMDSPAGFFLVDSSVQTPGALNNGSTGVSAVSNAAIPVATVGSTAGMSAGTVVRMFNVTSAQQLGGYDFTVGYNTFSATEFSLDYMSQIVAGTTGIFRVIPFNPIYYPRWRYISKVVSSGVNSIITMTVTHGYKVGQKIAFRVPAAFGMVELDGLQGTITAIDITTTTGNSITVDIDSSSFTAFAWPLSAAVPFSPALVIPVGENVAYALQAGVSDLTDRTVNTAFIGMKLPAGANSPAGSASDVIYWMAGKSFSVDNDGFDVIDVASV